MRESARARLAWADYLAMGEERSLEKLHALHQTRTEPGPPTRHLSTLKHWSSTFGWQGRLQGIADAAAAEVEAAIRARRRQVFGSGLALDYERVNVLQRLATKLLAELEQDGRLWVRDVKSVGSGESAERVDIERFNAAEVEQLRGLLEDIAKEKGERVKRLEHSGREGKPIALEATVRPKLDDFDHRAFRELWTEAVDGRLTAPGAAGAAAADEDPDESLDPTRPDAEAGRLPDGTGA